MLLVLFFTLFCAPCRPPTFAPILVVKLNLAWSPLGPGAEETRSKALIGPYRTRRGAGRGRGGDIEALQYDPGPEFERDGARDPSASSATPSPDLDPDSPGLEQFYSKDVFVLRHGWPSPLVQFLPRLEA